MIDFDLRRSGFSGVRWLMAMALTLGLAVGCAESPTTVDSTSSDVIDAGSVSAVMLSTTGESMTLRSLGATGTDLLAAGAGTLDNAAHDITLTVPSGVTVKKVLLYWGRRIGDLDDAPPAEIDVEGSTYTGSIIGGPVDPPGDKPTSYMVDLTGEGFVSAGATNTVEVQDDLSGYDADAEGASLVVVVDDGSGASDIQIYDGADFAYLPNSDPYDDTDPITFSFASTSTSRTATLVLAVGDAENATRPNYFTVEVNGTTTQTGPVAFTASDGPEWDTYVGDVTIPAGESSVTVQLFSGPDGGAEPSSLHWVAAGLSVPPPPGGEGCTPGYWKNHEGAWMGASPSDAFTSVGFTDAWSPVKPDDDADPSTMSLLEALDLGGGDVNALARHAVAAWLNASHPDVSYGMSPSGVVDAFNAAVGGSSADIETTKNDFESLNEEGCPLGAADSGGPQAQGGGKGKGGGN